jgi:hypothetical protein
LYCVDQDYAPRGRKWFAMWNPPLKHSALEADAQTTFEDDEDLELQRFATRSDALESTQSVSTPSSGSTKKKSRSANVPLSTYLAKLFHRMTLRRRLTLSHRSQAM